jgi:serine/threonine protein kinase
VVKASSVAEAAKTTPELPAQLYKYLAVSMARKYRVLATTAGYGLQRSDAGVDPVDVEEVFGNPVFLSFYARFLRQEKPEKFPWFQAYTEIEEFRVMPIGEAATARGRQLYKKYVLPGSPDALAFLSQDNQLTTAEALAPDPSTDGGDDESYLAPEVFDMTIEEIKEELRLHTYDKFVASSHFAGVHELKCREKEVPTADHFYFLHQLGVGSFGEVYAVRKKDSQRRYAMKVMAKASQAQMSKRWAMYIRIECDVMASLFHPSLVNLNYCFQTPEAVFMVLDLVVGGDLEGFQTNFVHGPPTQAMVCFMAAELVSGFEYMHSQSVIHRDMKPPNVLIGSDGHLRIADFGLSLKLKPGEVLFDRTGTKPYMSPELHVSSRSARRGYSFAADWYALGVTLYEICNGGLDLPSSVQHTLAGLEEHKRALPSSFLFKDMRIEDFTGNMANLDPASKRFLADLLKANPAARPDSRSIKKHKFFATVNWAALDARRVQIPWTEAQMAVLVTKQLDENVAMRKTAKETLQHVYEMEKLEPVSKFDFVSPRAVMEEYLENIYQLRSVDERNII